MAARGLNGEIIRDLSEEIGSFYEKTESKYWTSLPSEAVPEKLAIQDLFKELNRLKEDSLKSYSRRSARDKLTASCTTWPAASLTTGKSQLLERNFLSPNIPIHGL